MQHVRVEKILKKPIEAVFECLADHEGYARFPGVSKSTLLQPGHSEKNGVGAKRRIKAGAATIDEDIVGFERPTLLEYRITRAFPLIIDHQLGRVTLEAHPQGTKAVWTSDFRVPVPLLGGLLEKLLVKEFNKGFAAMLSAIERI